MYIAEILVTVTSKLTYGLALFRQYSLIKTEPSVILISYNLQSLTFLKKGNKYETNML